MDMEMEVLNSQEDTSTGVGSKPYGIVAADLNNDAHLEYVVALYGAGYIAILTEYQAAEFTNKTVYSTGFSSLFNFSSYS